MTQDSLEIVFQNEAELFKSVETNMTIDESTRNITLKIKRNKKSQLKDNWSNYSIGEELHSDFVEISIADSGLGISSENLPKLFERFFQTNYNNQLRLSVIYIYM